MDNYLICEHDRTFGEGRLVYYTGSYTMDGSIYMGDVLEAKRFESYEDVLNFLMSNKGLFQFGFSVINIPDCTIKALEESKKRIISGNGKENELYTKYHTFYAIQ